MRQTYSPGLVVVVAASVVVVGSPEVAMLVIEVTSVDAVSVVVVTDEGLHGPAWTPTARPTKAARTFWAIMLKEWQARKGADKTSDRKKYDV